MQSGSHAASFLAFFRETLSRLPCVDPADHCADVHRYGCTDAGHKATSATYMCLFLFHPPSNIDAIILRQLADSVVKSLKSTQIYEENSFLKHLLHCIAEARVLA